MNGVKLTGGDTMNYWINDFRPQLLETLKQWDFLLINDSEARLLSGEHNLRRAAAKILEMGPHTLVIKRGEYGAILFRRDCHFMAPGYLLEDVFDPTGAGDCFAGGFIGYLAGQRRHAVERRYRFRRTAPRRDLRLRHGQLLLREVRRGPLPHADPRRNRGPLSRVQDLHRLLISCGAGTRACRVDTHVDVKRSVFAGAWRWSRTLPTRTPKTAGSSGIRHARKERPRPHWRPSLSGSPTGSPSRAAWSGIAAAAHARSRSRAPRARRRSA